MGLGQYVTRKRLLVLAGLLLLVVLFVQPVETKHTVVATVESDVNETQEFDARFLDGDGIIDRERRELAPGESLTLGPAVGGDAYAVVADGAADDSCGLSGEFLPGSGGVDVHATGSGFGCDVDVRKGPTVTQVDLGVATVQIG